MDTAQARSLAQHDRQVIGRVLGLARQAQGRGERVPQLNESLSKASRDLHRLYKLHPEIKPIRVKQLSLF